MKIYRTIDIKKKYLSKTTCDICGKDTDEKEMTTLINRVEKSYGEFYELSSITRTTYDFCGKCFKEKLTTFLNMLGAKATVISETDD